MNFYEREKKNDKDTYYTVESQRAIDTAVQAGAGKSPEEVRSLIRRSYPFGPLRAGRSYKIWNRLVLKKEQELGLEPRRHKK